METHIPLGCTDPQKINHSDQPLVSVVIPVYNGVRNEIERCVDSVRCQTYSNLEVILVDDFSSDNSVALVDKLLTGFPHKIIRHKKNLGLSQTWNDGISFSNGDYILLLQQDCHLLENNTLENTMKRVLREKEQILSGSQYVKLDSLNMFQKILRLRINEGGSTPLSAGKISVTENKCDLIKKSYFDGIGKFNGKLKQSGQDFFFSMKVKETGIEMKVAPELKYSIYYKGEDTFWKLIHKEYGYGKVLAKLFLYLKGGNFFKRKKGNDFDLMKKKYTSRVVNIFFPSFFFLGMFLSSLDSFFYIIMWTIPFLILWFLYQAKVVLVNDKSYGLKLPFLSSSLIMMALDVAYFFGTLVGLKDFFVHTPSIR